MFLRYGVLFLLHGCCCVISVCLIISHSVSLPALSTIPPAGAGWCRARGERRDWRQLLSGQDWDPQWRPDPALAAPSHQSGGTKTRESYKTKKQFIKVFNIPHAINCKKKCLLITVFNDNKWKYFCLSSISSFIFSLWRGFFTSKKTC